MNKITIFTNVVTTKRVSGGANNFLCNLARELSGLGVVFTNNIEDNHSLVFLNGLTNATHSQVHKPITYLSRKDIESIRISSNAPIIHRKVNFLASGPSVYRSVDKSGRVFGDYTQISFSNMIDCSVFQSDYSLKRFKDQGFTGKYERIYNGIDTRIFNRNTHQYGLHSLRGYRDYPLWDGKGTLKLCFVSWSTDALKGFDLLREIDHVIENFSFVKVFVVGRLPAYLKFRNICVLKTMNHFRLSGFLKKMHGYLALAKHETCSNALLEALACGLPCLYIDSGSNGELIGDSGTIITNGIDESFRSFIKDYNILVNNSAKREGYSLKDCASAYYKLFHEFL